MPSITPLDPKVCINHYSQLLKYIREAPSETDSAECSTPECSVSTYEPSHDEDSKMSIATSSTSSTEDPLKKTSEETPTKTTTEEKPIVDEKCAPSELPQETVQKKKRGRRPKALLQQALSGKNPRKSPRQHASTLAILSSLIQQRKRRSKNKTAEESLPTIPEEEPGEKSSEPNAKTPQKKPKPKIDYISLAQRIDDELDAALDEDKELDELDIEPEERVPFRREPVDIKEVLRLYDEGRAKEDERSCRRFFNGTPGRKPGRRKKKNKTGWPNKNKRLSKRPDKDKEDEDSAVDSGSVDLESEEESDEPKPDQAPPANAAGEELQPYVCVEKLSSDRLPARQSPKRSRRQRRMPGSPKSPRMLRRPRGRWYRER